MGRVSCSRMANVLDCNHKVSKFNLQLRYYIHFWVNTFGKGKKTSILHCYPPPSYGLSSTTIVLLQ